MHIRREVLAVASGVGIGIAGFLAWYTGPGTPLTPDEITRYVDAASTLDEPERSFLLAPTTLAFLEADDGAPFYAVNLFKLRAPSELDAFSRAVMPLWLARGAHPVLVGRDVSRTAGEWERLTIVRFRSRRDWMEIAADPRFGAALRHRIAAAEANLRLTVSAWLIPTPPVVALFVAALTIAYVLARRPRGPRALEPEATQRVDAPA